MLTKFTVTNFKNFKDELIFDFTKSKNYEFNPECVLDGIINKALVYGHNGAGKSNLGFAIFDIVSHLTDKMSGRDAYNNYLNAYSDAIIAYNLFREKYPDDELIPSVKFELDGLKDIQSTIDSLKSIVNKKSNI